MYIDYSYKLKYINADDCAHTPPTVAMETANRFPTFSSHAATYSEKR